MKRKSFLLAGIVSVVLIAMCGCGLDKNCIKEDEKKDTEQKDSIIEQAEKIEDNYGINIMWEGRCDEQRVSKLSEEPDLTYDEEKIRFALDEMEIIMARFPEGFFDEYKKESVPGTGCDYIDIYLCESIVHENDVVDSVQDGITSAYLSFNGDYVRINVNSKKDFKFNFSHELFHIIEGKIGCVSFTESYNKNNNIMDNIYTNWEKYNPDGYCYLTYENNNGEIHVYDVDLPYDVDTEDIDNVYFVSRYAQYSDNEDRAETFTYLIACDDANDLPESYNSPHVKEKAKFIVDMIDDTFECVDDNAYWARMYHEKYGD